MHVRRCLLLATAALACGRPPANLSVAPDPEPIADAALADGERRASKGTGSLAKAAGPSDGMVATEVFDLAVMPSTGLAPAAVVLLLRDTEDPSRLLPIYIGQAEGEAIARRLVNEPFIRPLTHDLLEKILERSEMKIAKVEVDALEDGTFLANLFIFDTESGTVMKIDARPSDSVVLATGAGAPIYVSRDVLDRASESFEQWRQIMEGETPDPRASPDLPR